MSNIYQSEIERLTRERDEERTRVKCLTHERNHAWDELENVEAERDALRAEVERLREKDTDTFFEKKFAVSEWKSRAEAAERKLAMAREALTFFADEDNWRLNGKCDPNSGNFIGTIHARAALAAIDTKDGEKDDRHP